MALVGEILASFPEAELAYLQVEERNDAARGFYERLGFTEAYRYCHR
jgi:ribosomal protein S18 acetylase RimI-like enzyme